MAKDLYQALEMRPDKLTLRINTGGGSVTEGFAMLGILQSSQLPTEVRVDGLAASMGSVIMAASKRVIMSKNAYIMIHRPFSFLMGDKDLLALETKLLQSMEDKMLDVYAVRMKGHSREEIAQMLADETWFTAEEALAVGLVDEIDDRELAQASVAERFAAHYTRLPDSLKTVNEEVTAVNEPVISEKSAETVVVAAPVATHEISAALADITALRTELTSRDAEISAQKQIVAGLTAELTALRSKVEHSEKVAAIADARRLGKWVPSLDQYASARSLADVVALIDALPVVVPVGAELPAAKSVGSYNDLSEQQKLDLRRENPERFAELHAEHMRALGYKR